MQQKRRLIIIPIIHTHADYGENLGSKIPFDEKIEALKAQYWRNVFDYIKGLPLDYPELKVYQDGLPNVSPELVTYVVDRAKPVNYDILRWLRTQGANIVGTENPELLDKEYNLLQATLITHPTEEEYAEARLNYNRMKPIFSEIRSEDIAQRIKATLPEGGMGILFIGLAHQVKRLLEQEMEVSEPEALIGGSSETLRKKLGLYGKERGL